MVYCWKNDLIYDDVMFYVVFLKCCQIMVGIVGVGLVIILGVGQVCVVILEFDSFEVIMIYNNFYEFGMGKDDFVKNVYMLIIKFWIVMIDGMVDKSGDYFFEDIIFQMIVEECIYWFCCVEVWLMVVLWNGFELVDLLNMVGVKFGVKYVVFEMFYCFDEMSGQCFCMFDWFYVEGLCLDEVMYLLMIMVIGIYG